MFYFSGFPWKDHSGQPVKKGYSHLFQRVTLLSPPVAMAGLDLNPT